jgi:hypothetical protein
MDRTPTVHASTSLFNVWFCAIYCQSLHQQISGYIDILLHIVIPLIVVVVVVRQSAQHKTKEVPIPNKQMESEEDEDDYIELLDVMPTMRLNDISKALEKPNTGVVNLDALLPAKEAGELVVQTLLYKIQPSVKVLSIRFNSLSQASIDMLVAWVASNNHLETLYTWGCGLDERNRQRFEDAWKKNLTGHRKDNMGHTFIRVTFDKEEAAKLAATA